MPVPLSAPSLVPHVHHLPAPYHDQSLGQVGSRTSCLAFVVLASFLPGNANEVVSDMAVLTQPIDHVSFAFHVCVCACATHGVQITSVSSHPQDASAASQSHDGALLTERLSSRCEEHSQVCSMREEADQGHARGDAATLCWDSGQSRMETAKAVEAAVGENPRLGPLQRRRRLDKDQLQIQTLTCKLRQQQKRNVELQRQLHAFVQNEAVAQLTNQSKEKQLQIDQLQHENRLLVHQQRLLTKQIEELQDDKVPDVQGLIGWLSRKVLTAAVSVGMRQVTSPMKKKALQDELRVCKESLRRRKEQTKEADEKLLKVHQQSVDLATKNKALLERLRKLEAVAAAADTRSPATDSAASLTRSHVPVGSRTPLVDVESIIASQEDEITRLQQRVALMKRAQHADKAKQDQRLQTSQAEADLVRQQLDGFHEQLFKKEKTIRSLFLQMKDLKRALQDLTSAQQTNVRMQQMVLGREKRFMAQHSPCHQSQQQLRHRSPSRLETSATLALPPAAPRKVAANRVYRTLQQLGFVSSPMGSQSPRKPMESRANDREEEEEELPPNCVQGKLVPGPPPSSAARRALQIGGRPPRLDLYTPHSRRPSEAVAGVVLERPQSDDSFDNIVGNDWSHSGVQAARNSYDSDNEDGGRSDGDGEQGDASASEANDDVAFY